MGKPSKRAINTQMTHYQNIIAGKRIGLPLSVTRQGSELECGDCKACCSVFEIQEINKPKDVPCPSLCKDGCGIHKDRPNQCREFFCSWVQGHVFHGKRAYRPDKLGIIVTEMKTFPLEGVIGIFRVGKGLLPPRARGFMRELEAKKLFFFEGSLYGKQELIDAWIEKYKERIAKRGASNGEATKTVESIESIRAGQLPE